MPSNLPPLGWVSVWEPDITGSASGALPSRRMKRLPIGSSEQVKPRPRAHSTRTRRASLSLASSARRLTPPRGVAPSFAIAMWRCHRRASSTAAAAFAADAFVMLCYLLKPSPFLYPLPPGEGSLFFSLSPPGGGPLSFPSPFRGGQGG